jgi:predicted enzyme related to lactoylglutathione lyase
MTRLIEVTIHVRDVERSRTFYEGLGVACGPVEADEPGGVRHVHASWGKWSATSDEFLLFNIYPADGAEVGNASLGFATDDLDALHQRLVAGGTEVVKVPEKSPWGRMATYHDPDGNTVAVTETPRP